jgi:hypothetical protein
VAASGSSETIEILGIARRAVPPPAGPQTVRFLLDPAAVHADSNTLDGERGPKLGDEWRDWDGHATPDAAAPKRLFFALNVGFVFMAVAASLVSWYLVAPRLAEWHAAAPTVLLAALAVLLAGLSLALGLVALMLLTGWPRSTRASSLARQILAKVERGVFWLGRVLSIDKDRLAHAFIRTNNALIRLAPQEIAPQRVLILLPRCLRKEQLDQARTLADTRGVEAAVVAGGEQARQRIREKRPRVVIGVACERDLLSGIRDVRHKLSVVGIANTRPDGPCRNTQIDLTELEAALDLCVRPCAAPAKSATART